MTPTIRHLVALTGMALALLSATPRAQAETHCSCEHRSADSTVSASAPAPMSTSSTEGSQGDTASQMWLHLPAVSHHFQPPLNPNRHWNQQHAALGVELAEPWEALNTRWTRRWTAGLLRDSLYSWGAYGGVAATHEVTRLGPLKFEAGASALVFYRRMAFEGKRYPVPAVLPMVTAEWDQKFGVHLLYVPHVRFSEHSEMPAVLFLQGRVRF